jgi:hypothetical protein
MATITAGTNGNQTDGAVYGNGDPTNAQRATKFVMNSDNTVTSVDVPVIKAGSPIDNAVLFIEADASGVPSDTPLYTSNQIAISTFATGGPTTKTFTFANATGLTPGATYWLVYARTTGAPDTTNYYLFSCSSSLTVSGGSIGVKANTTWTGNPNLSYFYSITTSTTINQNSNFFLVM